MNHDRSPGPGEPDALPEPPGSSPRITMESRRARVECLVCNEDAATDCRELAQAFTDHFSRGGAIPGGASLLGRVNRVDEWIVCDRCHDRLSGEDKLRLMSLWVVMEGLRNWIRMEMQLGLKSALPFPPPIQLA